MSYGGARDLKLPKADLLKAAEAEMNHGKLLALFKPYFDSPKYDNKKLSLVFRLILSFANRHGIRIYRIDEIHPDPERAVEQRLIECLHNLSIDRLALRELPQKNSSFFRWSSKPAKPEDYFPMDFLEVWAAEKLKPDVYKRGPYTASLKDYIKRGATPPMYLYGTEVDAKAFLGKAHLIYPDKITEAGNYVTYPVSIDAKEAAQLNKLGTVKAEDAVVVTATTGLEDRIKEALNAVKGRSITGEVKLQILTEHSEASHWVVIEVTIANQALKAVNVWNSMPQPSTEKAEGRIHDDVKTAVANITSLAEHTVAEPVAVTKEYAGIQQFNVNCLQFCLQRICKQVNLYPEVQQAEGRMSLLTAVNNVMRTNLGIEAKQRAAPKREPFGEIKGAQSGNIPIPPPSQRRSAIERPATQPGMNGSPPRKLYKQEDDGPQQSSQRNVSGAAAPAKQGWKDWALGGVSRWSPVKMRTGGSNVSSDRPGQTPQRPGSNSRPEIR